ncbi:MAG: DUF1178 family protein [Rubrivivax sp.]|nr:DUF1178 family protein [Rubrivivax sp.]
MKVLDLHCANGHGFEGWFASEEDFMSQNGGALIECPLCADRIITRVPSAPRLNLSGAREPGAPVPPSPPTNLPVDARPAQSADLQVTWLATVRHLLANTEDVGPRFAEEARRIHYGETPHRAIRGQASARDRAALQEEGIETVAIPVPRALEGPVQ